MYADDIQIYMHCRHSDVTTAASRIESCVMEIRDWMDSNLLKLNPSKTELILLSTRQAFNKFTRAAVGVVSTAISPENHVKSFGVTLDDQLKLSKHVSNVIRSCFYRIRQLKHIGRYLDCQSAATVVHSFVTSRVDFHNGLLAAAPVKQMDQQQRVLNAATLLLLHDFDLRANVRDRLHWQRMPGRVTFKQCTTVYKCLHGMARLSQRAVRFSVHRRLSKSSPTGLQKGAEDPTTQIINV